MAIVPSVSFACWFHFCPSASRFLAGIDKATYITFVSGLATVVALFCSVSFGFILYFLQSNRAERLTTYAELKNRLFAFQTWLLSLPESEERDLCMAMVFELEKLDLSDLPQTDYGKEYKAYTDALDIGLETSGKREFYLTSVLYSGYVEQLLSRIGIVSIKQVITESFLDTLAKRLWLVVLMIALLFAALIWLDPTTAHIFVSLSLLVSLLAILLFAEFGRDLYRHANEELDFIERAE